MGVGTPEDEAGTSSSAPLCPSAQIVHIRFDHTERMMISSSTASRVVQEALAVWRSAANAALRDAHRIARGGHHDPAATAELAAGVEIARQRWEHLILGNAGFHVAPGAIPDRTGR